MKVNLEKTFPMPVPPEKAWQFLQDIEAVATCMPGAKITERVDERHYKGTVTARVGPATLTFNGTIEVLEVDEPGKTLRMAGKGADRSGTSSASMDLTARIEATPEGVCNLVGASEVAMTGKAATFGGRMIVPVADQILKQFAANFAKRIQEVETAAQQEGGSQKAGEGAAAPEQSLNALGLLWSIIKDALRRFFGKKPG